MIIVDASSIIPILIIVLAIILLVKFSKFLIWYVQSFVEFFIALGRKIFDSIPHKKTDKKKENKKSISSYYSDYHM